MGEAKKRGTFEERKKEALKMESKETSFDDRFVEFDKQKANNEDSRLLQFADAVKKSLEDKNYLAALVTALTLPDICCSLDNDTRWTSGQKYAKWFSEYIGDYYISYIGCPSKKTVFLSGEECYALRCAYLHKASANISNEKIVINLDVSKRIEFIAEAGSDKLKIGKILMLSLENFCNYIINGVYAWLKDQKDNIEIQARIASIPKIHVGGLMALPGTYIG